MAIERYNAREAEPRWQMAWEERGIFSTRNDDPRQKYYVLEMFPYPSGRIHMGHVRNYAMGDVVARFKRATERCSFVPSSTRPMSRIFTGEPLMFVTTRFSISRGSV